MFEVLRRTQSMPSWTFQQSIELTVILCEEEKWVEEADEFSRWEELDESRIVKAIGTQ